ncbi:tetratricopeptide repeat protein [Streptomyces bambusae]|uniref:tetratricopeptide repeat protein n=1 Tax=Streptomyces bambusae TaxID=1550616 RepID=UPI001CFF63FA|nr:tetratricopeptide repeat protein [Streptomyces bambusae]MCB5169577.1 tetratricopeptide repeat protein [Streptomyces bambusae]
MAVGGDTGRWGRDKPGARAVSADGNIALGVTGDHSPTTVAGDVVAGDKVSTHHHHHAAAAPPVTWPLRLGAVPLLATAFQPRPRLRAAVDAARAAAGSAVLTQVLAGGGGVGKSQLAAAYASEAVSAGVDLVMWVPAGEAQQIVALYAHAARLVRAPGAEGREPEADARAFLDWAAATDRSWLVVLDDVTDPDAVGPWWPAGPNGWVLATTRLGDARMTGGNRTRVDVDLYTPEEAVGYLGTRLAGEGAAHLLEDRAADLAEALGRLPLALGHAAAYLVNEDLTASAYLALLADSGQHLGGLLPGWADTEQYGRGVAAALLLSLGAAGRSCPGGLADAVLLVTSLLDPAGHPESVWQSPDLLHRLSQSTGQDVTWAQARAALRVLHRYHLITYDSRAAHRQIRIHALTARATREAVPVEALPAVLEMAADVLVSVWPRPDHFERDLAAVLRANAAVLMHHHAMRPFRDSARDGDGAHEIEFRAGLSLEWNGFHQAAADHWAALVSRLGEALGPDHPDTHSARGFLATSYRLLGRLGEAQVLQEQVVGAFDRLLGPDHPRAQTARNNLALIHLDFDRPERALPLHARIVAAYERILGPDDLDLHAARSNLAHCYSGLGRPAEALPLEEPVLAAYERLLGPDHPRTQRSRNNLAATYVALDLPAAALPHLEVVLATGERLLDPDHPEVHSARANLAAVLFQLGRLEEALPLQERVLAARERLLAPDHPLLQVARVNLANTYYRLGRAEDSLPLEEQVLASRERLLGPDHPKTETARGSLGATYRALGRGEDAERLWDGVRRAAGDAG